MDEMAVDHLVKTGIALACPYVKGCSIFCKVVKISLERNTLIVNKKPLIHESTYIKGFNLIMRLGGLQKKTNGNQTSVKIELSLSIRTNQLDY
jgi:hypothetical protein